MSKDYSVEGTIKIPFRIDVDGAGSEQEAIEEAKEILKSYYHLDVVNAYHDHVDDLFDEIYGIEYEEDEEE